MRDEFSPSHVLPSGWGSHPIGTRGKNGFGEYINKAHDRISQARFATRMMRRRRAVDQRRRSFSAAVLCNAM
jgi:hypothetical protein